MQLDPMRSLHHAQDNSIRILDRSFEPPFYGSTSFTQFVIRSRVGPIAATGRQLKATNTDLPPGSKTEGKLERAARSRLRQ